MSVVYSGHVWLGREGKMKNDPKKYENVMAVGWLYGAPAQLVVRAGSGIKSAKDLVGKKVGVGNAGSGAFANCELFFSHLGNPSDSSSQETSQKHIEYGKLFVSKINLKWRHNLFLHCRLPGPATFGFKTERPA